MLSLQYQLSSHFDVLIIRAQVSSLRERLVRRQLKADGASEGTLEVVTRAITMLTINNKANQDYIRYARLLVSVWRIQSRSHGTHVSPARENDAEQWWRVDWLQAAAKLVCVYVHQQHNILMLVYALFPRKRFTQQTLKVKM